MLRLLGLPFRYLVLGPALMIGGAFGAYHTYTVTIPQEAAFLRSAIEIEGTVTARTTAPAWPVLQMIAPKAHVLTARYETTEGAAETTTEVPATLWEASPEGARVTVEFVAETGRARVSVGSAADLQTRLMMFAALTGLGFGLTAIGAIGRML
ncbi:MAG: hypothetical protein AAF675_05660 [Pseudomonadota bacterium]